MMKTRITLIVGTLLLVLFDDLVAQGKQLIIPNARIRVSAPIVSTNPIPGTVVTFEADTIMLMTEGQSTPLAIPVEIIKSLEISRGRKSMVGNGCLYGTLTGAVTGVVFTYLIGRGGDENDYWPEYIVPPFAGLGLLTGTVIGALWRAEQWEEVPLECIHVGFLPSHGFGFSLSFSL